MTRAYRVHGRVQGVGFRWWARSVAEDLGLGGTVRNLGDGSVEIHAAGPAERLEDLEESLRAGPRFARVDGVETLDTATVENPREFKIEV